MEKLNTNILNFEILNKVPIGMFIIDRSFNVLFWNQCLEDWSKINADEIIGKSIFIFFPNLKERKYLSRINEIFEGGAPVILSSQMHKFIIPTLLPNEKYRTQHTTVTSIKADSQGYNALFAIEDVTDLAQSISDFKDQNKKVLNEVEIRKKTELELNEVIAEMESFNYTISHDLKAPLRGILGFSHELMTEYSEGLGDDEQFCLTQISSAALKLNELIDELLAYSRIRNQKIEYSEFNVKNVINSVLSEYQNEINARKINIEFIGVDIHIYSWKYGLNRILANILQNAIKYTAKNPSPQITIIVTESLNSLNIAVKDNGIGFNMKFHDRIFGLFNRLVTVDDFEGTGVGLAIVKKVITKLNGKVWAESTLNEGATFFIEIPHHKYKSNGDK